MVKLNIETVQVYITQKELHVYYGDFRLFDSMLVPGSHIFFLLLGRLGAGFL